MERLIWIFLCLVFVSWVCDYPLQGFFLAEAKCKSNYALFVHCFIWAMGISLALVYFSLFSWLKFIQLLGCHLVMDYIKCRGLYKNVCSDKTAYIVDQIYHVVQVAVCLA